MQNYKAEYTKLIHSSNLSGSNKASSYILALDWLSKMLEVKPFHFADCKNIWTVDSVERLHELYAFVLEESKKKNASVWNIPNVPKSYLQNGYCSAALKSLQEFLVVHQYEQKLFDVIEKCEGNEDELQSRLSVDLDHPEYLIEGVDKEQGVDVIRSVRVRANQHVFRKVILKIYSQSCCITGLNIPEINRASHIIPWAEDDTQRLDPRNGLCLSATYDAAFDRNLISLDDDYRMILSKSIADHYTSESVKSYFFEKEGAKISLPSAYLPNRTNLEAHRNKGDF